MKYPRGTEGKSGARAESTTESSRNTQPTVDAAASAEDGSPETGLAEGTLPGPGVTNCLEKPPSGLQDPGGSLEKPVLAAHCTDGKGTPAIVSATGFSSSSANCDCGSIPPDLEELSLLDPFPRYMKSCQDLIVPEKCLCTDRLNGKDLASSPPGRLLPGGTEASHLRLAPPARGSVALPGCSPSGTETQAFHCCGPQADPCAKELPNAAMEDSQEKPNPSPLLPPPPQGQSAAKPLKDDPSRLVQQVREEGWSLRTSESLTLAEVYLMMGKPSKLQLEYDWLAVLGPETQDSREPVPESASGPSSATLHKQKLLSCLLKLISTEVNPKPVSILRPDALGSPCLESWLLPRSCVGLVLWPAAPSQSAVLSDASPVRPT